MLHTNDLAEQLSASPRNCWLALNRDESVVVAHGATMDDAVNAARQKGEQEPVLLWAPDQWVPQVY
ncbi:MAG: hypothetical protein ABSG52_03920 [Terriglobales bacterium]|jgi:hypothetical protein